MDYSLREREIFVRDTHSVISNLNSNHNKKTLQCLFEKIVKLSPDSMKILENFLLQPLISVLMNQNLSTDERKYVLDCIGAVLLKSTVKSVQQFLGLYRVTCDQIFDITECRLKSKLSEELKLTVVNCLRIYTTRMEENVLVKLYAGDFAPVISEGVYLAAQIITKEKSTKLRCAALEFLLAISQYKSDGPILEKVADNFSKFTPGIVGPLSDIATKDAKAHHEILVLVVRCWGHILRLVLKDFPSNENHMDENMIIQSWMKQEEKVMKQIEAKGVLDNGVRTADWAKAAVAKLQHVLENVLEHFVRHHPDVRNEMISMCRNILTDCRKTLGQTGGVFLDALVFLKNDEHEKIARKAKRALLALETSTFCVKNEAQERLPHVLDKLSRSQKLSISSDEFQQSVSLLVSYLEFFPMNEICTTGPCIISNPLLLTKLIHLVTSAFKIEFNDEILQQSPPASEDLIQTVSNLNEKTDKKFDIIFCHLAYWEIENTVHILLEKADSGEYRLESLAVLNGILSQATDPKSSIVQSLVQYFLDKNAEIDLYDFADASLRERKKLVLKVSFIMQGIGYLSKAIGFEFEKYLLRTIYPVTEKIGCPYIIVQRTAYAAARTIATACYCQNVETLLESNLDYLTHHIIIKLKRTSDEGVLDAVRVIAKFCPSKAVPQLQHVVNGILSSSTAHIYSSQVESYLRVFLAFVYCAATSSSVEAPTSSMEISQLSAIQQLKAYITKKEELRSENEETCDEGTGEETKPTLPAYVAIAGNVVRRCLHYLSTSPDKQKVLCLEVLDAGLRVLADWEDELLPLVHEVWSPLVRRFDSHSRPLLISRSFSLLCTLTRLAKDFIRHRTLKEVLPTIRDFLVNSSKTSREHVKDIAYHTTQSYKLQRELLQGLGGMTCDLKLHERETDWVVEAALPYLNKNQPKSLQACAVGLYLQLLNYDPVLVAYRLQPIEMNEEFQKNVEQILT